jgi:hypothetical protein
MLTGDTSTTAGNTTDTLACKTLRQELKDARQEVRNLTVMAMRPGMSPAKAELIRNLERSARAEVKLRLKALRYAESQAQP